MPGPYGVDLCLLDARMRMHSAAALLMVVCRFNPMDNLGIQVDTSSSKNVHEQSIVRHRSNLIYGSTNVKLRLKYSFASYSGVLCISENFLWSRVDVWSVMTDSTDSRSNMSVQHLIGFIVVMVAALYIIAIIKHTGQVLIWTTLWLAPVAKIFSEGSVQNFSCACRQAASSSRFESNQGLWIGELSCCWESGRRSPDNLYPYKWNPFLLAVEEVVIAVMLM